MYFYSLGSPERERGKKRERNIKVRSVKANSETWQKVWNRMTSVYWADQKFCSWSTDQSGHDNDERKSEIQREK